jgi:biotin carboxylase
MNEQRQITLLCLASDYKGVPFIEEASRLGGRVLLLVREEAADSPWPLEFIDGFYRMPDLYTQPNMTYAASYLARSEKIDRIIALDDYDVATASALREHLRLPGMGDSIARHFRDKLAMRVKARQSEILAPPFSAVFNYEDLDAFMRQVQAPWVLKPRFEAGAKGIRKLHRPQEVWRALEELGDEQSYYLLEQFLPGDVYHVDSIIWDGHPLFALASKYGAPPLSVTQGGGIFNTRTLDRGSAESQELSEIDGRLLRSLQHKQGVAHTEFIRAAVDGRFYFLETAARVGGANIDRMVKAATGIELWAEAARVEVAGIRGENYQLPHHLQEYAGLITCLARQENPDLSSYNNPEIVWRLEKPYHAGLLIASTKAQQIESLLQEYNSRFAHDFLHHFPGEGEVRTTI